MTARRSSRTVTGRPAAQPVEPRPRPRLTGRAALLGLILLVLVISYASSLRAWLQQRDEIAAARAQISESQHAIDELERTQSRWLDDAYIEAQARKRLGWVLPGEIGYRVIDEDGNTLGDLPPLSDPLDSAEEPAWYASLWGSVVVAGRDEAEEAARDAARRQQRSEVITPSKQQR